MIVIQINEQTNFHEEVIRMIFIHLFRNNAISIHRKIAKLGLAFERDLSEIRAKFEQNLTEVWANFERN